MHLWITSVIPACLCALRKWKVLAMMNNTLKISWVTSQQIANKLLYIMDVTFISFYIGEQLGLRTLPKCPAEVYWHFWGLSYSLKISRPMPYTLSYQLKLCLNVVCTYIRKCGCKKEAGASISNARIFLSSITCVLFIYLFSFCLISFSCTISYIM